MVEKMHTAQSPPPPTFGKQQVAHAPHSGILGEPHALHAYGVGGWEHMHVAQSPPPLTNILALLAYHVSTFNSTSASATQDDCSPEVT